MFWASLVVERRVILTSHSQGDGTMKRFVVTALVLTCAGLVGAAHAADDKAKLRPIQRISWSTGGVWIRTAHFSSPVVRLSHGSSFFISALLRRMPLA